MRTLTGTLETAQEAAVIDPIIRITFSDPLAVEADVVIEQDRISGTPLHGETPDSQTVEVICDNSDGYFTALNLEGWDVVFEWGLVTSIGDEYSAIAPLKVLSQNMSSLPGVLQCRFSLIGIPNRLAEDKASKDYFHHWSDTKTVKAMLTEIADGEPVATELTEKQEDYNAVAGISYINLDNTLDAAGQRLSISRTVTKLSFMLKKTGNPAGDITFVVRQVEAPQAILLTKVWGNANTLDGVGTWREATFDASAAIDEEITWDGVAKEWIGGVWIYCEFTDGDAGNYVQVAYSSVAVKADEWLVKVNGGVVEYSGLDCFYRYKYTGVGIDCWARGTGPETYCEAYEVVYDPNGTHTAGIHATIMTDSAAAFKTDALIGQIIYNRTDGSSGTITDNDATTVTVVALAGGGDNQWDTADAYTIEDPLLDVYQPKDSYRILEGQSRRDKINQLLGFTGSEYRAEADGKLHVFVPVTTGVVYDSEYSLAAGHKFFSKAIRNALVVPNRVVVTSLKTDETEYSGAATSATSFALLPISDYIRTSLVSDAQGVSIAEAMISRLEVAAQRGAARVPMNLGSEVFDYVKVNARNAEDASRTGNLGSIKRSYKPGRRVALSWRMDFGFGGVALKGVPGTRPSLLRREPIPEPTLGERTLKWGMIKPSLEIIDDQLDWLYGRGEYENELTGMKWAEAAIAELWGDKGLGGLVSLYNEIVTGLGWIEGQVPADEQIDTALLPYLKNIVEDTTPQLGGDLDLNGKNLDFPTTANISDCLDEDNMASDSATKLATQQSIKKYVDDNVGGVTWSATSPTALTDSNRTTTSGYTDLDLTANTSATAKFALIRTLMKVNSISAGGVASLYLRKNGETPGAHKSLRLASTQGDAAGAQVAGFEIIALDAGQVLEWNVIISGTIDVDTWIYVLGYI